MKNLITCTLLMLCQICFGETGSPKPGVYRWTSIITMEACRIDGTPLSPFVKITNKIGQTFNFIKKKDEQLAIVQILNYRDGSPEYLLYNNSQTIEAARTSNLSGIEIKKAINEGQYYFLVDLNNISDAAQPVFALNWQFAVGALTMPVKMRIQKEFDFSGSFNISAAGGVKKRVSRYHENFVNGLVSIGLSSVAVDSFARKNSDIKPLPDANLSALTIGAGFVFEFGNAQAGIMLGWDYLTARDQKNYQWKYNGKPWFAIGFGLAIFGKQQETADPSKVTNGGSSD